MALTTHNYVAAYFWTLDEEWCYVQVYRISGNTSFFLHRLFNSWPGYTGTIFGFKNLVLKELEIRIKIMYCVKYYKTRLKPFCFSGPDL